MSNDKSHKKNIKDRQLNKNSDIKEFQTIDIKSQINIFWIFIATAISTMGTLLLFSNSTVVGSTVISIFMILFLPILLLLMLTSKIKFEKDYVESSTILGNTKIQLDKIKTFGVYSQVGRFTAILADPSEDDKSSFLNDKRIFISTKTDFNPNKIKGNESISFQYRKDIYDLVRETLKNK